MTHEPNAIPSRLDPERVPRRDLLGLTALWTAAGTLFFSVVGMMRIPKAAVLSSPSKKFRVALPDTLAPGVAYVPPGRSVALFKDEKGVHAISTICTHLGCIVRPETAGFECPCHGSRYDAAGVVTKGPAPKSLPWLKVVNAGGQFTVDEGATVPPRTKVSA